MRVCTENKVSSIYTPSVTASFTHFVCFTSKEILWAIFYEIITFSHSTSSITTTKIHFISNSWSQWIVAICMNSTLATTISLEFIRFRIFRFKTTLLIIYVCLFAFKIVCTTIYWVTCFFKLSAFSITAPNSITISLAIIMNLTKFWSITDALSINAMLILWAIRIST